MRLMPAHHWILKTEPGDYSFEDLLREKRTVWDGITNALALKHLRTSRAGDLALVYHTGAVRAAMGIARISGSPRPDPKLKDPARMVVELEAVKPLARPVTLEEMKENPELAGLELLRLPRLSFVPVGSAHWGILLKMAGTRL
jgi:predicted RNA-binding protein with PUA-like domain